MTQAIVNKKTNKINARKVLLEAVEQDRSSVLELPCARFPRLVVINVRLLPATPGGFSSTQEVWIGRQSLETTGNGWWQQVRLSKCD